ncbi:unnamed protein product, partial [Mesorhabditis belari]|uniref:Beta-Casp domain-containing protein n=1 Tax=Mesorhabditis belari TaxID=2138241 RepID=A0AAF3FDN7_9BILA
MFDFKHIKPFDDSVANDFGAMVLFSTPGMLHGGQSLRVFKQWCHDPKNMIIMPGYCVAGTLGAKVINGMKKVDIEGKTYDVNLGVEYMSFSAHADAKGIMQLIRDCKPRHVMFVHGEAAKMEFLKEKVEKEFRLKVSCPANGETVSVSTEIGKDISVPMEMVARSISLDPTPAKRACPFRGCIIVDRQYNDIEVVSYETVAKQFDVPLHTITLSQKITGKVSCIDWDKMAKALSKHDAELQAKQDGIEMFHGEICVMPVRRQHNQVELMWDESRELWKPVILEEIQRVIEATAM